MTELGVVIRAGPGSTGDNIDDTKNVRGIGFMRGDGDESVDGR